MPNLHHISSFSPSNLGALSVMPCCGQTLLSMGPHRARTQGSLGCSCLYPGPLHAAARGCGAVTTYSMSVPCIPS